MSKRSKERPSIIARGYDDKPSALYALELQSSGRHVNVSGSYPPPSYIGWPMVDAFDYDEGIFSALEAAYDKDDRKGLRLLYVDLEARPKTFVKILRAIPPSPRREG